MKYDMPTKPLTNFMPAPRIFIDLSLYKLDEALVGCFSLSISKGIIWR